MSKTLKEISQMLKYHEKFKNVSYNMKERNITFSFDNWGTGNLKKYVLHDDGRHLIVHSAYSKRITAGKWSRSDFSVNKLIKTLDYRGKGLDSL